MKVVLFCGGYGMRMRDGVDDLPKPMVPVGGYPLLWHVMRYYVHHGHRDFVLCLGYGAAAVKEWFGGPDATATESDFVLRTEAGGYGGNGGEWTITFAHTGPGSTVGERLRRVRHLVEDEEMFLANYCDVLTDLPLDAMVGEFAASGATAALLAVPPRATFHCVDVGPGGEVTAVNQLGRMPIWQNGGYFVLRPGIFEHLPKNGDLEDDACAALAKAGKLIAHRYRGFWFPVDTLKERATVEAELAEGRRPWMVWER